MKDNIILIGMMGSGKTTVGRMMSNQKHLKFIDTDAVIECNENRSINDIFKKEGESLFRDLETKTLIDIKSSHSVVSCGGGIVLKKENVSILQKSGHVFYLRASKKTLLTRLEESIESRPLLNKASLETQITNLLINRESLYSKAAHHIITVDNKSSYEVCEEIYRILRELDYKFS